MSVQSARKTSTPKNAARKITSINSTPQIITSQKITTARSTARKITASTTTTQKSAASKIVAPANVTTASPARTIAASKNPAPKNPALTSTSAKPIAAKSPARKGATPKKDAAIARPTSRRATQPAKTDTRASVIDDTADAPRTTKRERVLALLSQAEGASIAQLMQATDWQEHSVRGFLAGTVKKKLGFILSSAKDADDVRRYRIKTRRAG